MSAYPQCHLIQSLYVYNGNLIFADNLRLSGVSLSRVHCTNFSDIKFFIAYMYDKLMVVGGYNRNYNYYSVEIIDLSGKNQTCFQPADFPDVPYPWAVGGVYFKDAPTVCGVRFLCFQYNSTVSMTGRQRMGGGFTTMNYSL